MERKYKTDSKINNDQIQGRGTNGRIIKSARDDKSFHITRVTKTQSFPAVRFEADNRSFACATYLACYRKRRPFPVFTEFHYVG